MRLPPEPPGNARAKSKRKLRNLVLVLGDQLDGRSAAFDGFDRTRDAVLQMEVWEEATYIPQHKRRLAFFFAAMRHFRDEQRAAGRTVHYAEIDDPENRGNFVAEIQRWIALLEPETLIVVEPGDWRVSDSLAGLDHPTDIRPDRHFFCSHAMFTAFADDHPNLLLETFYRAMRKRHDILIDADSNPVGGAWNFDRENRAAYGRHGPYIPIPKRFPPDATTEAVLAMVERRLPDNPGRLADFTLPVTRAQALTALDDFVEHRLPDFGRYQDAMVQGEPILFHSHLSAALNLHLLDPREVVDAVIANPFGAPLNSVEGFVRQVIGWREYVRGVYWRFMPDYATVNALEADLPMPRFFWTGETDMRCLADAIGHTIDHAYAHHIERLMVLGLFCLLLGVRPFDVHRWHLSMFIDAIDWVSLPNTVGMSQFGDGGRIGTKPYVASGAYINRMSDHCRTCRYHPAEAVGDAACPFTTLYWDFLARHETRLSRNQRMQQQFVNLRRKDPAEMRQVRTRAAALKTQFTAATFF